MNPTPCTVKISEVRIHDVGDGVTHLAWEEPATLWAVCPATGEALISDKRSIRVVPINTLASVHVPDREAQPTTAN